MRRPVLIAVSVAAVGLIGWLGLTILANNGIDYSIHWPR